MFWHAYTAALLNQVDLSHVSLLGTPMGVTYFRVPGLSPSYYAFSGDEWLSPMRDTQMEYLLGSFSLA